jgi:hypothetical protein
MVHCALHLAPAPAGKQWFDAVHCSEYVGSHILRTRTPWQSDLLGELMDKVRPGSVVVDAGEQHVHVVAFSSIKQLPSQVHVMSVINADWICL